MPHTAFTAILLTVGFISLQQSIPWLLTLIVMVSGAVAVFWFLQEIEVINMRDWLDFTNREALQERRDSKQREMKGIDTAEFKDFLKQRVIGQDRAVDALVEAIARRMRRQRRKKPILSALLVGPTGWGKSELAKGVAEFLFGTSKNALLTVDVGNMDAHGVSSLIGSPSGYAGSDHWGMLTGHLHTTAKTLILFDEVEKAGRDPNSPLYKMLLSLLDEGRLTDQAMHQSVSAVDALVIMTSNAESKKLGDLAERYQGDPEQLERATKDALHGFWAPELLARIDLVLTVRPLGEEDIARVCIKHLFDLAEEHRLKLVEAREAIDAGLLDLALDAAEPLKEYGVRAIVRWLDKKTSNAFAEAAEEGAETVRLILQDDRVICDIVSYLKDAET